MKQDGQFRSYTRPLHRMLAMTFLPPPNFVMLSRLHVNHKDGDKSNNNIIDDPEEGLECNLEWFTPQQNCIHAYKSNLRKDNIPLILTNVKTGNEFYVNSYGEAGNTLNCTPGAVHGYMNRTDRTLPYRGYWIEFADKNRTHRPPKKN